MKHGFTIDGQRQPREPQQAIGLLDGAGIDLRLTPLPLVFELSGLDYWGQVVIRPWVTEEGYREYLNESAITVEAD